MFPEPTQLVGYLAPGTQVADPANDSTLLAETRDHYWLQIDVGAGFQDADTSGLPGGGIGMAFASTIDTFNEVDDALRHKVRVSLEAETYNQATAAFNSTAAVNGSNGLTTSTVLDKTWNAVELVGKPISISQFVDEKNLGGLAFTSRSLTYTPYFIVGDITDPLSINDELFTGTPFQELLTNFPLGSNILTGLTMNIDLVDFSSAMDHHETMLIDRIGYSARHNNTNASLSVDAQGKPALTPFDVVTLFASVSASSRRDPIAVEEVIRDQQANLQKIIAAGREFSAAELNELQSFHINMSRLMGARYLWTMDWTLDRMADAALSKAYWDRPRIILAKMIQEPGTATTPGSSRIGMDLLNEFVRVIAAPGQVTAMEFGYRLYYGMLAGSVEQSTVESLTVANAISEVVSVTVISKLLSRRKSQQSFFYLRIEPRWRAR